MNDHQVDFFNKITDSASRLTATENAIAEHLMKTYPNCMLKTSYELAGEIAVNVSTVTRFFQKIGYKSIKTAQSDFKKAIDLQANSAQKKMEEEFSDDTRNSVIGAHAVNEAANIEQTFNSLLLDELEILVGLLSNRRNKVVITGNNGTTGALSHYLFNRMAQVRPGVTLLNDNQDQTLSTLATTEAGDVLMMFDYKQYSKINKQICEAFKARKGRIILFTDSPLAPIGKIADIRFETRTYSPSPFASHVAALALINLIVDMLTPSWDDYITEQTDRNKHLRRELGL